MNRRLHLLTLFLLLAVVLAACGNDDEATLATATPAATPVLAATDTAEPPPTSTPLPLPTATAMPPTETSTATPLATEPADATGQGQTDPGMAATTAAAAGMTASWQSLMNVAALNQALCTTLQGLAQSGQQGGLGALAASAGLLGAGPLLQSAQQQLTGLMGLTGMGLGPLLGSLQADQAAMSDIVTRWTGGQLDAAGAGAALQAVCGASNTTLSQTQQGAQDAGLSEEEASNMMNQSKLDAANSLGGLRP